MNIISCGKWAGDEWREEGLKAFRRAIEKNMDAHVERSRLDALSGTHKRRLKNVYRCYIIVVIPYTVTVR
ncbi:MAG: hypothetical protein HY884_01235 [Deltaproteobacteria bacterium]|nr:hypothetical protein [Deltaproteobacteria bacterium]